MQAIFENENKRSNSGRANSMSSLIYIGGIGRGIERKCDGRTGSKRNRV